MAGQRSKASVKIDAVAMAQLGMHCETQFVDGRILHARMYMHACTHAHARILYLKYVPYLYVYMSVYAHVSLVGLKPTSSAGVWASTAFGNQKQSYISWEFALLLEALPSQITSESPELLLHAELPLDGQKAEPVAKDGIERCFNFAR